MFVSVNLNRYIDWSSAFIFVIKVIVMITKLLISVFIILGKLNEKYLCNFKQYCITEALLCFIFICCLIFPLSHDINPEKFFFP